MKPKEERIVLAYVGQKDNVWYAEIHDGSEKLVFTGPYKGLISDLRSRRKNKNLIQMFSYMGEKVEIAPLTKDELRKLEEEVRFKR